MAAINHGGTFYRLDKSSQSDDCGEAGLSISDFVIANLEAAIKKYRALKITVNQLETAGPFGLVAAKFSGRKIKKDTNKNSASN